MKKISHPTVTKVFILIAGCLCSAGQLFAVPEESTVQLSPFEVISEKEHPYDLSSTTTGSIIAMPRSLIPFVTSVVTSQAMEDLGLLDPSSFSSLIAGVSMPSNGNQMNNDGANLGTTTAYQVRGFGVTPLYNGFQTGRGVNQSPFAMDRAEVTKSPNSILYGQSSAGGTVNFVPKGASIGPNTGSVMIGAGSNQGLTGSFDVNGKIGNGESSAVRIGGGYQQFERSQQFFWASQANIYGAYRVYLAKNIILEVDAQSLRTRANPARTQAFPSLGSGKDRVTNPYNRLRGDLNFNYYGPWSYKEGNTWISSGYLTNIISSSLTARVGGFYARQDQKENVLQGDYGLATADSATGYYNFQTLNQIMTGIKADLLHQGELFQFKVKSLIGFEQHLGYDKNNAIFTKTNITVTIPLGTKPLESQYPQPPNLSLYSVPNSSSLNRLYWTNFRFTQVAISNNDDASVFWGVARGDGTNKFTDDLISASSLAKGAGTTYTGGATYRIFNDSRSEIRLFADYSTSFLIQSGNKQEQSQFNGFTSVAALKAYIATVKPNAIDPETGKGYEVGIRANSKDGKLRGELTLYNQRRENIGASYFVRESNVVGNSSELVLASYLLASGIQQDKGVELSVNWNPTKSFALTASANVAQGRVISAIDSPGTVGLILAGAPDKMANMWARYKFARGSLSGWVVGAGANYASSTRVFPGDGDKYRFSNPYTVMRFLVAYELVKAKHTHKISLNVDNVLNRKYVDESDIISEPTISRLTYRYSW
jgi:iron complex outermembrane recepter protein